MRAPPSSFASADIALSVVRVLVSGVFFFFFAFVVFFFVASKPDSDVRLLCRVFDAMLIRCDLGVINWRCLGG